MPAKTDRKMGPTRTPGVSFTKQMAITYALAHQLDELVKNDFLKDYLQEPQDDQALVTVGADQGHEVPIHGEVNTISGGFSGGGCTAS